MLLLTTPCRLFQTFIPRMNIFIRGLKSIHTRNAHNHWTGYESSETRSVPRRLLQSFHTLNEYIHFRYQLIDCTQQLNMLARRICKTISFRGWIFAMEWIYSYRVWKFWNKLRDTIRALKLSFRVWIYSIRVWNHIHTRYESFETDSTAYDRTPML